jgi:NTP pyrophosphatase (non-canonical NTP hydrolase)
MISSLQKDIHDSNAVAGWWTDLKTGTDFVSEARNNTRLGKAIVAEKLCLIHSEVSEAMEGARKNLPDDKLPHRPMIEVELADAVIRILDLCGALNLDLEGAITEKRAYNAKREDHKVENRLAAGGKAY